MGSQQSVTLVAIIVDIVAVIVLVEVVVFVEVVVANRLILRAFHRVRVVVVLGVGGLDGDVQMFTESLRTLSLGLATIYRFFPILMAQHASDFIYNIRGLALLSLLLVVGVHAV